MSPHDRAAIHCAAIEASHVVHRSYGIRCSGCGHRPAIERDVRDLASIVCATHPLDVPSDGAVAERNGFRVHRSRDGRVRIFVEVSSFTLKGEE